MWKPVWIGWKTFAPRKGNRVTSSEYALVERLLATQNVVRDGILVVHSGIKHLSRHGLRAEAICQALIDAMPNGTILMPTMTWRTVNKDNPVFDEMNTPSHTGVLTEVFRTQFASHRSLHPTHSVAGLGPLAGLLLSTHHWGTTPCAGSSPYGLMRDYDASVLLLGVGLESCTAIHHAEEMMAPDLYVRPLDEAESYTLRDRHGIHHHVLTRRHPRLDRDFAQFGPILADKGQLASGVALDTPWQLFSVRNLYRDVFHALTLRPDAILKQG